MSEPRCKRLRTAIAINIACLLALVAYVMSMSVPSSEATRLRNALLIDTGSAHDFAWTPQNVPDSFKAEHLPPSPRFRHVIEDLGIDGLPNDWEKALRLASHLTHNAYDKGPIQSTLDTAYEAIVHKGKGYCADFTQVYLALAHAAGLFAREWGTSVDGFGGNGHSFVEVFDRQRGRWVWLDVFNNVHAVDTRTGEPVSALEFRRFILGERGGISIVRSGPGRLGYKHTQELINYYRRGAHGWYLWWGNAVFTYDQTPLVRAGQYLLPAAAQLTAMALGVHPRIVALAEAANAAELRAMAALRLRLRVIVLLALALVASLALLFRRAKFLADGANAARRGNSELLAR